MLGRSDIGNNVNYPVTSVNIETPISIQSCHGLNTISQAHPG